MIANITYTLITVNQNDMDIKNQKSALNGTNVYPNDHLTHSFQIDKLFISKKIVKIIVVANRLIVEREGIADARPNPPAPLKGEIPT